MAPAAAAAAAAAQMIQRCIAFSLARQRVYLFGDAMRYVASWYISTTPFARNPSHEMRVLTDVGGLVISASVYPKLPFDPSRDFSPVAMVSYSPHVLAVHPSVRVNSVKELIDMARAQPGKLNFAISGIGGAPQLAGIEFAQRTGIQWTYIPYKGGSDAVTAVAAGQADVLFNGMLATCPSAQGARLRAL